MKHKFILILLFVLVLAGGCDRCRNPKIIDTGELSPEILALVPYTDGQVVRLKHSGGHVIDYHVTRNTTTEVREYSSYCETLKFRVNTTRLIPDYPAFPIAIYIANIDENYIAFEAMVGRYYFYLPKTVDEALKPGAGTIVADMYVNDSLYRDVIMMKTPKESIHPGEMIYVDSLWYNYSSGILKVLMSNKESFVIHE